MKQIWDAKELSRYWSLSYEKLQLLKTKPYKSHVAFCIQLKYYQHYCIFPENKNDLTGVASQYISEQLGFGNKKDNTLSYYDWEDRTARRHRQGILDFLGIRKFPESDQKEIQDWLCQTIFPKGFSTSEALEYVYEWLHHNKIDRPAGIKASSLERYIGQLTTAGLIIFKGANQLGGYYLTDKTKKAFKA